MKNKILFVCKWNRSRSKIAEAYFRKLNKNKKFVSDSAGIFKGSPTDKKEINIGKKKGIKLRRRTKTITENMLKNEVYMIVNVADDVPDSLLKKYPKNFISWKIRDIVYQESEEILFNKIEKKIKDLIKKLEK